jgi:hypothetical protein
VGWQDRYLDVEIPLLSRGIDGRTAAPIDLNEANSLARISLQGQSVHRQ